VKQTYWIAIGAVAVAGGAIAMAIRGDARGERVVDPVTAAREQAIARRDEVMAEEQRARDEMRAREGDRDAKIAKLVGGARPGQPGPIFEAIHFGSAGLSSSIADVQILSDAAVQNGFTVGVEPRELSAMIPGGAASAILHAWGDPASPIRDPGSHTELIVDGDSMLRSFIWRPYETLEHLIDPGDDRPPGSTPFSVVGAKLDDLTLALGDHLKPTGANEYWWALPYFDDASMSATLTVSRGVITSVTLQLETPPDDVAHALRDRYGDAGAMHLGPWKHRKLEISIDGHPPDGATVTATLVK